MPSFSDILVNAILHADVGEDKFGIHIEPEQHDVIVKDWETTKEFKKSEIERKKKNKEKLSRINMHYGVLRYREFPVQTICCDDSYVIGPKSNNYDGLMELYKFSKILAKEKIIDEPHIKFVHKYCGCT